MKREIAGGLPPHLAQAREVDLPPAWKDKLEAVFKVIAASNSQVILLTGGENRRKDMFAVCLGRRLKNSYARTMQWIYGADLPQFDALPRAGISIVSGVEKIPEHKSARLNSLIRESCVSGWFTILLCRDVESIETALGRDIVDYISHESISVDLSINRKAIFEL